MKNLVVTLLSSLMLTCSAPAQHIHYRDPISPQQSDIVRKFIKNANYMGRRVTSLKYSFDHGARIIGFVRQDSSLIVCINHLEDRNGVDTSFIDETGELVPEAMSYQSSDINYTEKKFSEMGSEERQKNLNRAEYLFNKVANSPQK